MKMKIKLMEQQRGEIAVQLTAEDGSRYWQKLISSASYSSFDLKATIQSVKLEGTTFHVILEITDKDGKKGLLPTNLM